MNRFLPLFSSALVLASVVHAQTVSRTYTRTDGWGNSTSTTIQGPASIVGTIANQGVYGNWGGYGYNAPAYGVPCAPTYNYAPPGYGYYPGQTYFVPGYTVPLGQSNYGWDQPPTITALPQIITTPPVQAYPVYPGYGYGNGYGYNPNVPFLDPRFNYNYGFGSRTTVTRGKASYSKGGLSVSVGGATTTTR